MIPPTFYCVAWAHAKHVTAAASAWASRWTCRRSPTSAAAPRAPSSPTARRSSSPPDATEKVQYEGELVVVIGKRARGLSKADALSCVLGYSISNDVSERTWQKADRTLWRAKNSDTFKPMGPWIETDVPDLDKLESIMPPSTAPRPSASPPTR